MFETSHQEEIYNFLQNNQDITSINSFRNDQWLDNQKESKTMTEIGA